jgi:hypothetical protein
VKTETGVRTTDAPDWLLQLTPLGASICTSAARAARQTRATMSPPRSPA